MNPKIAFDAAIGRAEHLLKLYELVSDTRQRSVRSDWAQSFRRVMHWPATEQFVRVDGVNRQSMLIIRQSAGVDRSHFAHEFASELLRATVIATVSALDRYCHDVVVHNALKLLKRADDAIPEGLCRFQIPLIESKKALEKLRRDHTSRPGSLLKRAIQVQLHERTFQTPGDIEAWAKLLGIKNVWTKLASVVPGRAATDLKLELGKIARRRNQIAHEADLVLRTRSSRVTLREIRHGECEGWVKFVKALVQGLDEVVKQGVT